jgi:aminoglycoside phosphotransferase (APT) family kinase protein
MGSFPTTPEALTDNWLSAVLDTAVDGHRVEYLGEGTGVIGLVTRVHLTSADGPESLIAKFPSPAPENRAVAATYDMYGREVRFYQDIASHLPMRTARCFHAEHDPDTQDFVLLLEDLTGYRIGDQVAGCTLPEARAVVDAIAALHAATWTGAGFSGLPSHASDMQRDGMIAGFQMGWPVVIERFPELVPERALTSAGRMPEAIGRLLADMCTDPVCLSHADVRLDNIFFGTDGDIVLVDWQSVCTSAPEQDLAYFLTQSVPRGILSSEDLVLRYHTALTSHGIDYPLERCRARYRISALYLLCYAVVIAGTLDMGNERGRRLARTLLGNSLQALDEMNAFELLDQAV